MLTIINADPSQIEVALNVQIDLPAVAFVGVDNNEVVGSGGLAWGGGRCWLWFIITDSNPSYARPVLMMTKRMLAKAKQFGETEVFVIRDPNYATSARLVKLAGFKFHALENGNEVFKCDI
jgi:hypothetical protein